MKQIAILGSTGSIGTQALEVIEEHADLYEVYCLTANNKVELLAQQAHKFKPAAIVIANEARYEELKQLMSDMPDVKVYAGARALDEIVEADECDVAVPQAWRGLNLHGRVVPHIAEVRMLEAENFFGEEPIVEPFGIGEFVGEEVINRLQAR